MALRAQIAQGAPKVCGQNLRLLGDDCARPRHRAPQTAGQAGLGGCNTQGVSIHPGRGADAAHLLQYRALGQQRHKGIGLNRQGRVQSQHGIDEATAGAMRHGEIHVQFATCGVLRQRLFEHRQSALAITRAQSALRAGDCGVDLGRVSHTDPWGLLPNQATRSTISCRPRLTLNLSPRRSAYRASFGCRSCRKSAIRWAMTLKVGCTVRPERSSAT